MKFWIILLSFLSLFYIISNASAQEDPLEEDYLVSQRVSKKVSHTQTEDIHDNNSHCKILPAEIWLYIISFLNEQEKRRLSQSCIFFNGLCNNSVVWTELIKLDNRRLTRLGKASFPLQRIEIVVDSPILPTMESLQNVSFLVHLRALNLKGLSALESQALGNMVSLLTNLEDIRVRSSKLDDRALAFISIHDRLRVLHFQSAKLTENSYPILQKLTSLQELSLWRTQGAPFCALAYLTNLTSLDVPNTNITDKDLEVCSHLSKLVDLRLGGNRISDAGLASLAPVNRLRVLHLGYTDISEDGLRDFLPFFHNLEDLSLIDIPFTRTVNPLDFSRITNLKVLNLSNTQVTAAHLKTLRGLRELYLYDVDLDEESLRNIKNLTTLSSLSLSKKVKEEAVQDLTKALPNLREIFH